MEIKSRESTDQENFYYEMGIQSPKNNLEIYDRLLIALITIDGIFLSTLSTKGSPYTFLFFIIWSSLAISLIGILPEKKVLIPNDIDEMKEFIDSRLRFKKLAVYFSFGFLFLSFGFNLAFHL